MNRKQETKILIDAAKLLESYFKTNDKAEILKFQKHHKDELMNLAEKLNFMMDDDPLAVIKLVESRKKEFGKYFSK